MLFALLSRGPPKRVVLSRRVLPEDRFDWYLHYFRKVHLNTGHIFREGLLEASRKPFGDLLRAPWGAQWRSWVPLGFGSS